MARKQGLVPIGEAFSNLAGPANAIGDALADLPGPVQALIPSRQTQRHFTQADHVNQLVAASEADPDRGFMARMMALCSLPRTNPGYRLQYKRVNGPYKLVMVAGADNKLPFWGSPLPSLCGNSVSTTAAAIPKPAFAIK